MYSVHAFEYNALRIVNGPDNANNAVTLLATGEDLVPDPASRQIAKKLAEPPTPEQSNVLTLHGWRGLMPSSRALAGELIGRLCQGTGDADEP